MTKICLTFQLRCQHPRATSKSEYQQFADDFWLLTDFLNSSEGTVAYLSWEGDRPGGADVGFIERYEDRYVFWILGVDIWEDLGRFPTTADAVESWIDRFPPSRLSAPHQLQRRELDWACPFVTIWRLSRCKARLDTSSRSGEVVSTL